MKRRVASYKWIVPSEKVSYDNGTRFRDHCADKGFSGENVEIHLWRSYKDLVLEPVPTLCYLVGQAPHAQPSSAVLNMGAFISSIIKVLVIKFAHPRFVPFVAKWLVFAWPKIPAEFKSAHFMEAATGGLRIRNEGGGGRMPRLLVHTNDDA